MAIRISHRKRDQNGKSGDRSRSKNSHWELWRHTQEYTGIQACKSRYSTRSSREPESNTQTQNGEGGYCTNKQHHGRAATRKAASICRFPQESLLRDDRHGLWPWRWSRTAPKYAPLPYAFPHGTGNIPLTHLSESLRVTPRESASPRCFLVWERSITPKTDKIHHK